VSAEQPPIVLMRPGLVPYAEALELQGRLERQRQEGSVPDVLILLEHPPVYTKGRRTRPDHLPFGEEWYRQRGIEIHETDRGGQVTYHGPGQLVAYPIVDLAPLGGDVKEFVRGLERVIIAALADFGVPAQVIDGLTGVWTAGRPPIAAGERGPQRTPVGRPTLDGPQQARKIASIGIHVDRGVTTHGLAVNVNNDLAPFEWIVPCGIEAVAMTSVSRERGDPVGTAEFGEAIARRFCEVFARRPIEDAEIPGPAARATAPVP